MVTTIKYSGNYGVKGSKAVAGEYLFSDTLLATTTSGYAGRLIVRSSYMEFPYDYSFDKIWGYVSAGGTAAPNTGNAHLRLYLAGPNGELPAIGDQPIWVSSAFAVTASGAIDITLGTTISERRLHVTFHHDCGGGNPNMLLHGTSSSLRSQPTFLSGGLPQATPGVVTGATWTEASFLSTNTWGNGTGYAQTASGPACALRTV